MTIRFICKIVYRLNQTLRAKRVHSHETFFIITYMGAGVSVVVERGALCYFFIYHPHLDLYVNIRRHIGEAERKPKLYLWK